MATKDCRIYRIWSKMRYRCQTDDPTYFKYYKSLGIKVCDQWENSSQAFKDWALANGYQDNLSLDRIKAAKIYGPDTCTWSTKSVQSANTSSRRGSSSQYVGVSFVKNTGKYCASLWRNKKNTYIGYFDTEEEAAAARDAYVKVNALEGYTINLI